MDNTNDWARSTLKEAPYWKDGMTPEEYDAEREYYYNHLNDVKKGTYKPMWKQK